MLSVLRRIDSSSQQDKSPSSQFLVSNLSSGDIFGEVTILSESESIVFPTSIVSETLSICFRLDKVQLQGYPWDDNTKKKLSTRIIRFQDDETLKKAKLNEVKIKKQSDIIVRKLRNVIRAKNIIKKFSS